MGKLKSVDLEKLLDNSEMSEKDKDRYVWAFIEGRPVPLINADEAAWSKARKSGEPGAHMVSDMQHALGEIRRLHPGAEVSADLLGKTPWVSLRVPSVEGGFAINQERKSRDGSLSVGTLLAQSFSFAHEHVTELRDKASSLGFDVDNVAHPKNWDDPESGWTIEECKGSFRCVHRELRLASTGFGGEEEMARNAPTLHWHTKAAIDMRDRFENLAEAGFIPDAKTPSDEAPSP